MSNDSTAGCPKCAGLAACWCPPLSPIALDKAEMRRFFGVAWEGGRNEGGPAAINNRLLVEQDFECALRALDAQLSALVARVAQEEREKCAKELETKARSFVRSSPEYRRYNEAADLLRGTP